jgi:hypothetical protein
MLEGAEKEMQVYSAKVEKDSGSKDMMSPDWSDRRLQKKIPEKHISISEDRETMIHLIFGACPNVPTGVHGLFQTGIESSGAQTF